MHAFQLLSLLVLPALAISAALNDLTTYTISNKLTAALALAFLPAAFLAHLSPQMFGLSVLIGLVALLAGMGMFALGWIGGGDAKLLAGCAMWVGATGLGAFLAWTAVAGGVLAMSLLALRRQPMLAALPAPPWALRLIRPGENVPYGVAIAVGALVGFPGSPLFHAL